MNTTNDLVISPSHLGDYVKNNKSNRFIKIEKNKGKVESRRDWKEAFMPLEPILSREGNLFEDKIYEMFEKEADKVVDSWSDYNVKSDSDDYVYKNDSRLNSLCEESMKQNKMVVLEQVKLSGRIGSFFVPGDADLIVLWPLKNEMEIHVFDMKASWEEKTYQQIQTACYTILLRNILDLDFDVSINGGIIYKETDLSDISKDSLPSFNLSSREDDVKRLLSSDGELKKVFEKDLDEVEYQLDDSSKKSPYNEVNFVESLEDKHIRLLGLTRGEQKAFKREGLSSLEDVAKIVDKKKDSVKPYKNDIFEIKEEYEDVIRRLIENYGISRDFIEIAQKSRALLSKIDSSKSYTYDKPWGEWLQGSGNGELPDDDPPGYIDLNYPKNSLIRVYFNIQKDYIHNTISLISSRVTSTKSDIIKENSEMVESVYDDHESMVKEEEKLINNFMEQLYDDIKTVGSDMDMEKAPIHFYFYTEKEKEDLYEMFDRQDSDLVDSLYNFMSLREGVDQKMYSIVKNDIDNRVASKQISNGLLPIYRQSFLSNNHSEKLSFPEGWRYEREDGKDIDLRKAFNLKVFNYNVPYLKEGDDIRFYEGEDDYYPLLGRFGSEIPLEYIWGCKEIEKFTSDWIEDSNWKGIVKVMRKIDLDKSLSEDNIIKKQDVKMLSKKMAHALNHIERSLRYKNPNIEKESIELENIESFSINRSDLADSIQDYMKLEYKSDKEEKKDHYRKDIKQRIMTGKSLPIKIKKIYENSENKYEITCDIIYDEVGFENPKQIAESCRITGNEDGSGGDWMIMAPLIEKLGKLVENVSSPREMLIQPMITVKNVDHKNQEIILNYFDGGMNSGDFTKNHKSLNIGNESNSNYIVEINRGDKFILEPRLGSLIFDRANTFLKNSENNTLLSLLKRMKNSEISSPQTDKFSSYSGFNEWLDSYDPSPNDKQRKFINETDSKISLLQGPPGTGKTSGSMSLALLSRVYSLNEKEETFKGLVTGASNKSIDELLEDFLEALEGYSKDNNDLDMSDVLIVRATSNKPSNPLDNVEYIDHYNDDLSDINELLFKDSQQSKLSGDYKKHIIIFSTPTTLYSLMRSVIKQRFSKREASNLLPKIKAFNLLAIDEASMMPLPHVIIPGSFIEEDSQILLSGDQRQMPPVRKHEWEDEKRKNLVENPTYLSILDYLRFLRGDDIYEIDEDKLESPNCDISMVKLNTTYRCHTKVAQFLQDWIYEKDDINYMSNKTHTINSPSDIDSENLESILNPDNPVTLILHNDSISQQTNITEAKLGSRIIEEIPDSETIGVVTPHNAQKGLLKSFCKEDINIDTVERFQGGQRDTMIISATVSDPDYLEKEKDFILNPNRLNVAISRMKKKLIIMAPKNIFKMIPDDPEKYRKSSIWKGLYSEVNASESPEEKFKLSDLFSDVQKDSTIEVYSLRDNN